MKIVYFAPIEFQDLKQRPQHIAEELSKNHEIWYIEPTISWIGTLKRKNLTSHMKRRDISSSLHILRLNGYFALPIRLQHLDLLKINTWFEKLQLSHLIPDADIWWIGYEPWARLLTRTSPDIIYDKMDDNVLLNHNKTIKKYFIKTENILIKKSSVILVTAKKFYTDFSKKHPNVHLIPNGIGLENTVNDNIMEFSSTNTKKTFGYIGRISHWFDMQAIETIAKNNPDCEIHLLGPNDLPKLQIKNVIYHNSVPKSAIPEWINKFDVCLYPFKKDKLLETINPVKIYEYLAMNKPVLAIDSTEMDAFRPFIYCYKDYNELKDLSQKILDRPFNNIESLHNYIAHNTWEQRAHDINTILEHLEDKK